LSHPQTEGSFGLGSKAKLSFNDNELCQASMVEGRSSPIFSTLPLVVDLYFPSSWQASGFSSLLGIYQDARPSDLGFLRYLLVSDIFGGGSLGFNPSSSQQGNCPLGSGSLSSKEVFLYSFWFLQLHK